MDNQNIKPVEWDDYSGSPADARTVNSLQELSQMTEKRKQKEKIEPLPITESEYQILMPLLASYGLGLITEEEKQRLTPILEKINLENCTSLSEAYFEIKRRARYGNNFSDINIGEMEEELFDLEEPLEIENNSPTR